jgi:hypothetical protein
VSDLTIALTVRDRPDLSSFSVANPGALLVPQGQQRIIPGCAAGWQIAGQERDRDQYERHRRIYGRIRRADVEEQGLYGTAEERCANQPEPDADASFP